MQFRFGSFVSLVTLLAGMAVAVPLRAADGPTFTRQEDVIYGRKDGTALTLDVFTPKSGATGAAAIFVVSGGWFSRHESIDGAHPVFIQPLVKRGITVFAVVPGSQPRYTIQEITQDITRSVRFIRRNAATYKIDPSRIGIYGGSAGGHLSLMQGLRRPAGNPAAPDPVDREGSDVRAIAAFYPPTDFFNYGQPGENALGQGILVNFKSAFAFRKIDEKTRTFVPVTPEEEKAIGVQISPITHADAGDPPTLLIHGDADKLVPFQQSQILIDKLKAAGVTTKLVTKPGAAHGWPNIQQEVEIIADWFVEHLK